MGLQLRKEINIKAHPWADLNENWAWISIVKEQIMATTMTQAKLCTF